MAAVLLDTNILVFLADAESPRHLACRRTVEGLLSSGDQPTICPQVAYEFWNVATRPKTANGLGWTVADTHRAIERFCRAFWVIHDSSDVLDVWLSLVRERELKGKRIHDAHLLATMLAHGVTYLLTYNLSDFPPVSGVFIKAPEE